MPPKSYTDQLLALMEERGLTLKLKPVVSAYDNRIRFYVYLSAHSFISTYFPSYVTKNFNHACRDILAQIAEDDAGSSHS